MLYRNKRTGAVIETLCRVSGGDWEPVKAKKAAKPKAAAKEKPEAAE
jgi:hypothetical protein